MNQYKVCVYAISKNEEQFVDRWMDAVSEADQVVVVDTGSTDGTVAKLRERGAVVFEETITPWRFDKARNLAMDHTPEDTDICVSNDLDEVFESGWRTKLEQAWSKTYTRASYLFTWSYHADGTPNKQFPMEKIHRRHGFRWVHPVHEVLEYTGTDPDRTVRVPGLVLNHYPDLSKPRSQYLPLLELSVAENPQNDRAMFWLGREYVYNGKHDQAIQTLKRHLALPTAAWKEERSASMRLIADCFQSKGDLPQAKAWLFRAVAECPDVREAYYALAKMGYEQHEWPLTYAMVEKALQITQSSGSYLVQPECWGESLYTYGAVSAYRLGLYHKSKEFALKACEHNPTSQLLQSNLELIQKKLDEAVRQEVAL